MIFLVTSQCKESYKHSISLCAQNSQCESQHWLNDFVLQLLTFIFLFLCIRSKAILLGTCLQKQATILQYFIERCVNLKRIKFYLMIIEINSKHSSLQRSYYRAIKIMIETIVHLAKSIITIRINSLSVFLNNWLKRRISRYIELWMTTVDDSCLEWIKSGEMEEQQRKFISCFLSTLKSATYRV